MLDHRRLSYFLAVAAERSFTRAAERLHVAQPALSRQVRLLEDELGGPLLVRGGTDGVTPTAAGALLMEQAPELLLRLEQLGQEVARMAGRPRPAQTLRFAYAASAAHGTAPPILCALRETDPELTVQARVMGNAEAIDALHRGDLDAALLRVPASTDGLSATIVRREPQGVVIRHDHPLAERPVVPIAGLSGAEIVIHERAANPGRYDAIAGACRAAGFEPAFVEPLLAFDPTHSMITGDRVTVVSDPGGVVPPGLTWRPVAPAMRLDIVLLTPLVAAPATVALLRAAQDSAARFGWLEDEPAQASAAA